MVWAKISDRHEIRKMELKPEMSFDQLKEKVAKLFPNLEDFTLQYRDSDGDMISLSSDEELHFALSQHPSGDTLYLQVFPTRARHAAQRRGAMVPTTTTRTREETMVPFGGNILGRFLEDMDPFWTPTSRSLCDWCDPFGGRNRLEQQWDQQMAELRKKQEEHMKQFEEQRKKAEADVQKTLQERRGGKGGEIQKKGEPTWHVQTFGSWEPEMSEGPFGKRTVIGPVGYHMYWGYSEPEEPMEQGGEQKHQQEQKQKQGEQGEQKQQQGEQKQQQGEQKKEQKKQAAT